MEVFFRVASRALASFFVAASLVGCGGDAGGDGDGPKPARSRIEVFEYTPAPGQFIGEGDAFEGVDTPEAARTFAEESLSGGRLVSLGAFGGYIVVGLGETILNVSGADFYVTGNPISSGCEPGVVWVMADDNGNGAPDDRWYELAGSETGSKGTVHDYEITYRRPADGEDVPWTDNAGGSGVVPRNSFHTQPGYYPEWIVGDSYTLGGTLVEVTPVSVGGIWENRPLEWGYADNIGTDVNPDDSKSTLFDISNAIDETGERIAMGAVDFIKVQTAAIGQAGPLGEVSTEVSGFGIAGGRGDDNETRRSVY